MRSLWLMPATLALCTSCVGGRSGVGEIGSRRATPDDGVDASAASDGLNGPARSEMPDTRGDAGPSAAAGAPGVEATERAETGGDTSEEPDGKGSGGSDAIGADPGGNDAAAGSGGMRPGGSDGAGAGGAGGASNTGTLGGAGGDGGFGGAVSEEGSAPACGSGLQECDAECIDVSVDRFHCGSCNASCDRGNVCESGSCTAPRPVLLVPSDNDRAAVSVGLDGDIAVVGTEGDDNGYSTGAAYVFERSGANWVEVQKLLPSDSAAGDDFGDLAAVSGDTLVVGASFGQGHSAQSAAYVFVRTNSNWIEQQKLVPDGETSQSLALSGDTVIMGVPYSGSGLAQVFVRSGETWTEQQTLVTTDGTADDFGYAVAVSGDTAMVGARRATGREDDLFEAGAVYVFERSGSTWVEQQKLTASDGAITNHFGYAVALSGDTAVVSPFWDQENDDRGAAYVFRQSDSGWIQEQKLAASDAAAGDGFGHAVATSANLVVVGAPGDDPPAGSNDGVAVGSAYVFSHTGSSWTEELKVVSPANRYTPGGSEFGSSIAVSGDTALISTSGWVYTIDVGLEGF